FAALGTGTIGLGIPRFLLRVAAVQAEDDDRAGAAHSATPGPSRPVLRPKQFRQTERERPGAADAQQPPAAPERPRGQGATRHVGHSALPPRIAKPLPVLPRTPYVSTENSAPREPVSLPAATRLALPSRQGSGVRETVPARAATPLALLSRRIHA